MLRLDPLRYFQQLSTRLIFLLLLVGVLSGGCIALAGEVGLFLPLALLVLVVLTGLALLAIPAIAKLVRRHGVAVLFVAGSLLWSAIFDFVIASNTTSWMKYHKGWSVRAQGIGAGLIASPVVIVAGIQLLKKTKVQKPKTLLEFVPLFWIAVAVISALVGLLQENAMWYMMGDSYRFLLIPLVYWACIVTVTRSEQREFLWKFMVIYAVPISLITILNQTYKFAIHSPFMVGKSVDAFALSVSALLYTSSQRKRLRRFSLLVTVILMINAFVSWERRDWLIMALVWGLVLLLNRSRHRYRLLQMLLVASCLVLISLLVFNLMSPGLFTQITARLQDRFDYTFNSDGLDPSSARRFLEMEFIAKEFKNAPPIGVLTGLGQGAEFHDPIAYWKKGSQPGLVHNVHNTYTGVFFRTGLLGVFLIGSFIFLSLRLAYKGIRNARRQGSFQELIFSQASLIYLLVAFGITWNVDSSMGAVQVAVVVGLLVSAARDRHTRKRQSVHSTRHDQSGSALTRS